MSVPASLAAKYNVFHIDQTWVMRAYDELPISAKKQIQGSIYDTLRVKQFGEPSSFCRVFKLNEEWIAKVNRYEQGSTRSMALQNNFRVCHILREFVRTKPYIAKFIVTPEFMFEFHEGGEDVFVRFERLVQGDTVSKYITDPQKRADLLSHQDEFIRAMYVIVCVIAILVNELGFNHNDMHMNNVMLSTDETGKYIPKIMDFDLATVTGLEPRYVHPGILKSMAVPDFEGCDRKWWFQQQKEHSGLIPGRAYPSLSIDTAMFFDSMYQDFMCNYSHLPLPMAVIAELEGIRRMHYNALEMATQLGQCL